MPTPIAASVDDLLQHFPSGSVTNTGGNISAPCPFCKPTDKGGSLTQTNADGVIFYGEDRLYLFPDRKAFGCRICKAHGRGPTGKGWWPHSEVAKVLGVQVAQEFLEAVDNFIPEEKPLDFLTYQQVQALHKNVKRDFWYGFGWTDEVIDRFMLGYGHVPPFYTPGNTIPMKLIRTTNDDPMIGYHMALRDGTHRFHQSGSMNLYTWHIQDEPERALVAVVEGEKDAITAWLLGYRNIVVALGTNWRDTRSEALVRWGYKRAVILVDGDDAGQVFATKTLIPSLSQVGIETRTLDWKDAPEGCKDISDLLLEFREGTAEWIEKRLVIRKGDSVRASLVQTTPKQAEQTPTPLEQVRSDAPGSIYHAITSFLADYGDTTRRGHGKSLLLATGPGAGKTHTLVRIVEKVAQASLVASNLRLESLKKDLKSAQEATRQLVDPGDKEVMRKQVEIIERKIDEFSFLHVSWFGQYKDGWDDLMGLAQDDSLWFNFEARNEDNCENLRLVMAMGRNHHNIGTYCANSCPVASHCRLNGYLKQLEDARKKPIVFCRHQHLVSSFATDARLVVVDEYSGHIMDSNPVVVDQGGLHPAVQGWEMDLDDRSVADTIAKFVRVVSSVIGFNAGAPRDAANGEVNPDYIISGSRILRMLDEAAQALFQQSLGAILEAIDEDILSQIYQPSFSGTEPEDVYPRSVPALFHVISREFPAYVEEPTNKRPSCMHMVQGKIEVYAADKITIRASTPVIIADATSIPELHRAMFGREVVTYSPTIRNPNAEVTVFHGSDWTKTHIYRELGAAMQDRQRMLTAEKRKIVSIEGKEFDPSTVPVSEDLYQSKLVRDVMAIIKHLVEKHSSLLVVTHKNLKELLESVVEATYPEWVADDTMPRLAWGHYGALRGTNSYQHYEAVALIGAFRIPYEAMWRRIQMWAWLLGIQEPIPPDIVKAPMSYDAEESDAGHEYYTFQNMFADKFVNMVERGEMQQCAERIRPHSTNKKKYVYVFASRPALSFVSHVASKTALVNQVVGTKHLSLVQYFVEEHSISGKLPTYRAAQRKFKASPSTVKRARTEAQLILQGAENGST
jgi:hypothetical protein